MNRTLLSRAILMVLAPGLVPVAQAQDEVNTTSSDIVEMVTIGRMRSAADDVMIERQESPIVADFIDTTMISRIGDSNVAAALRRVPGVTLVDDKYVFVRGLGERYSNSLLNGAQIPSPDLTRNVIPLDIFPTSILRSVAVQKGYSPEMPAAFSGGLIDIRTLGIPNEFLFQIEAGSSYNSETSGDVLSYNGGGDDWLGEDDGTRGISPTLRTALDTYAGSLDPVSILQTLRQTDSGATLAEAEVINRNLALELNRNADVTEQSRSPNTAFQVSVGNNFFLDNGMDLGFVAGGAYQNTTLSRESIERDVGQPDEAFTNRQESTRNVNLTANIGLGWTWFDDHSISTTSLLLRNTDDEASIEDIYTLNLPYSSRVGFQDLGTRYEQRELVVNQIRGNHRFGGVTRDLLGFDALPWLDELSLDWFYSDAKSTTEIPNETRIRYQSRADEAGSILSTNLQSAQSSGDFRFTDLEDTVENYGWDLSLPLYFGLMDVEFSGGYNYAVKGREYRQNQYILGTNNNTVASALTGLPSEILSDANILDPANGFAMDIFASNDESYLAAVANTASYGTVDMTWDETWRVAVGARWEDYSQVGLPWNPLDYSGCQISCDPDVLLNSVFKDDDFYPSLAVTYMRDDFWAEQFQLRFNYSETLVRPDLREITPSSYIDPITDFRVSGNANVVPSSVENYDLRGEWFFDSGDNLTVSLFYKDIVNPIDFFQRAGGENIFALEILNADSAEVYGVELEWLKSLAFLGQWADPFFVSGNITVLESELTVGGIADAPTNQLRPLAGASDHSVNLQLGYDSMNGQHSAMVVFNTFAERLYFAGRLGNPDAYEQPFNSLDFTYFYYPTDRLTLRLRGKNLLDEEIEIEQGPHITYFEKPGSTFSLDLRYTF